MMAFFKSISCDICGKTLDFEYSSTKKDIISLAKQEGWEIGKRHVCLYCHLMETDEGFRQAETPFYSKSGLYIK